MACDIHGVLDHASVSSKYHWEQLCDRIAELFRGGISVFILSAIQVSEKQMRGARELRGQLAAEIQSRVDWPFSLDNPSEPTLSALWLRITSGAEWETEGHGKPAVCRAVGCRVAVDDKDICCKGYWAAGVLPYQVQVRTRYLVAPPGWFKAQLAEQVQGGRHVTFFSTLTCFETILDEFESGTLSKKIRLLNARFD